MNKLLITAILICSFDLYAFSSQKNIGSVCRELENIGDVNNDVLSVCDEYQDLEVLAFLGRSYIANYNNRSIRTIRPCRRAIADAIQYARNRCMNFIAMRGLDANCTQLYAYSFEPHEYFFSIGEDKCNGRAFFVIENNE